MKRHAGPQRIRAAILIVAAMATAASCFPDPGGSSPPTTTTTTSTTTTTVVVNWLAAGCYSSNGVGGRDVLYSGPLNTANNAVFFDTADGSCSGNVFGGVSAILQAADESAAASLCDSLFPEAALTGVGQLSAFGYTVPLDAWGCQAYDSIPETLRVQRSGLGGLTASPSQPWMAGG